MYIIELKFVRKFFAKLFFKKAKIASLASPASLPYRSNSITEYSNGQVSSLLTLITLKPLLM